jgi:hypothetical protein
MVTSEGSSSVGFAWLGVGLITAVVSIAAGAAVRLYQVANP